MSPSEAETCLRAWFWDYLKRPFTDQAELNNHLGYFAKYGPGKALQNIMDSAEGRARRKEDLAIRKLQIKEAKAAGLL